MFHGKCLLRRSVSLVRIRLQERSEPAMLASAVTRNLRGGRGEGDIDGARRGREGERFAERTLPHSVKFREPLRALAAITVAAVGCALAAAALAAAANAASLFHLLTAVGRAERAAAPATEWALRGSARMALSTVPSAFTAQPGAAARRSSVLRP